MTVILMLEYASGRLPPMASLTGLVTRDPQHQLALAQSMTTHREVQVCLVYVSVHTANSLRGGHLREQPYLATLERCPLKNK